MFKLFLIKNKLYGINNYYLEQGLIFLGFSYKVIKNNNLLLSEKYLDRLLNFFIINDYIIDVKLKDKILIDIRNMKRLNTYKGVRHTFKLPVHGQHTKTNARTLKNKKNNRHLKKYNKKKIILC